MKNYKNFDKNWKKLPKEYLKSIINNKKINDSYLIFKFENYVKYNYKNWNPEFYCELFAEFLEYSNRNDYPIKKLVKFSLNKKNSFYFENNKDKSLSKRIIYSIIDNINKPRNCTSNPSIFLKLIGYTNIINFNEEEFEFIINFSLNKLNKFISCDKNILFLLIKIIKKHQNEINFLKNKIIESLIKSIEIYFLEFQSYNFRKDYEVIKNFISFIKALNYFKYDEYFYKPEVIHKTELIIEIIIITLFLDSNKEEELFSSFETKIIINNIKQQFKDDNFSIEKKLYQLKDEEVSSFSDYQNCQPKKSMNYDLKSNFFYYCCNFISNLMLYFPKLFYKEKLINFILGNIFDKNSFDSFCETMNLIIYNNLLKNKNLYNLLNSNLIFNEDSEKIQNLLNINKIDNETFNNIVVNISKKIKNNSKSIMKILIIEKSEIIKGYLFKLIKNLFKIIPLDIWFPNNLIKKGMKYDKIIGNIKSFCYLFQFELHNSLDNTIIILNYLNSFKKLFTESNLKNIESEKIIKISELFLLRLYNEFNKQINQMNSKKEMIFDYLDFFSSYFLFTKNKPNFHNINVRIFITKLIYTIVINFKNKEDFIISNIIKFFYKIIINEKLNDDELEFININELYDLIFYVINKKELKYSYYEIVLMFNYLFINHKEKFLNDDEKIIDFKILLIPLIKYKDFILIFKNLNYKEIKNLFLIHRKLNQNEIEFYNKVKNYLNNNYDDQYFNNIIDKDSINTNDLNIQYFNKKLDFLNGKINKNKIEKNFIDFYFIYINLKKDNNFDYINNYFLNLIDNKIIKIYDIYLKLYDFINSNINEYYIINNLEEIFLYNVNHFTKLILKDEILFSCLIIKMFFTLSKIKGLKILNEIIISNSKKILDWLFFIPNSENNLNLNKFIDYIFDYLLEFKNSKTIWTSINTLIKIINLDKENLIDKTKLLDKIMNIFKTTLNIKTMNCIVQNLLLYDNVIDYLINDIEFIKDFFKSLLNIDKLIENKCEDFKITYEKNLQIITLKRFIFPFLMLLILKLNFKDYYDIFEMAIDKINIILDYFSDFSKNICLIEIIDEITEEKIKNKELINYEYNKLNLISLFEKESYENTISIEEFNKKIINSIFDSFKKFIDFINENDEISINLIKYEILLSLNKYEIKEDMIVLKNIFDKDINNIKFD